MLSTIRRQQADMRRTLEEAEAVLIRPGDLELADKAEIGERLIGQLTAYTEYKHRIVFPTLLASPDPVIVLLAGQMRTRCDAMAAFYRRHVGEWPAARILEERALYRGVALDVIGRLRQHFVREEADLVRLTERPVAPARAIVEHRAATGF